MGDTITIASGTGGTAKVSSKAGDFPTIIFDNKTAVTINDPAGGDTFGLDLTAATTGLTTLNLNGGGSGAESFNVQATPAGLATTLTGGVSVNTATIGSLAPVVGGGKLAGIQGPVTVTNTSGGQTGLTIDDGGDSTAEAFAIVDTTTSGGQTYGRLRNLGTSAAVTWDIDDLSGDNDIASLTIDGGSGGNTIQVSSGTAAASSYAITLNSGAGIDTVDVAPQPIGTNLTVNGQTPAPPTLPGYSLFYSGSGILNPGGVGSGSITQTGAATVTYAGISTLKLSPSITSITPVSGPLSGSTSVIITGTNLLGASAVMFGTTQAMTFTVNSATQIMATSPGESAGTVDVTVTVNGLTSSTSSSDQFTYVPPPTVASLSTSAGPTAGGTSVVITGTNLNNATAVMFGTTPASSFTVNSPTQITAQSPLHAAGQVDVTVTTIGGPSAAGSGDKFTFMAPPTVVGLSPNEGPTTGTTSVVITGTNLSGATAVMFGTVAATSFTVNSATQITAFAPAEGAGTINVVVTTPGDDRQFVGKSVHLLRVAHGHRIEPEHGADERYDQRRHHRDQPERSDGGHVRHRCGDVVHGELGNANHGLRPG